MTRKDKLQCLLITELLDKGHVELTLPDGLTLELGIIQENEDGELIKTEDYAWLIASQDGRTVSLDSYNFGLSYPDIEGKMLFEHDSCDSKGQQVKVVSII